VGNCQYLYEFKLFYIKTTSTENHGDEWTTVEFDFLVEEEFLRQPLLQHLQSKDISTESTINIEYVERYFGGYN